VLPDNTWIIVCVFQEVDAAQRLRETKASAEVTNEKLEAELEQTKRRLRDALATPLAEGVSGKTRKGSVVTRSERHAVLPSSRQ